MHTSTKSAYNKQQSVRLFYDSVSCQRGSFGCSAGLQSVTSLDTPHNLVLHHCPLPCAGQPSAGSCQSFSPTPPLSLTDIPSCCCCRTPCSFQGDRWPGTTLSTLSMGGVQIPDISRRSLTHTLGLYRRDFWILFAYILLVPRSRVSHWILATVLARSTHEIRNVASIQCDLTSTSCSPILAIVEIYH